MKAPDNCSAASWAAVMAEAYAADAKPPLTDEMTERLRQSLATELGAVERLDDEALARANEALDAFELSLKAVAGPRLVSAPNGDGFETVFRSEAGRPLRSFGGQ